MQNNEENQKEILEKIKLTFQEAINSSTIINTYLENRIIQKLPTKITTGNHEVYKICYQGNAEIEEKEDGGLFLFPGSGIAEHTHHLDKGITETYTAIAPNKFHYQGKEYDFYECNLNETHGVDIEDTARMIQYCKTNQLLKKNTSAYIKQRKK